MVQIYPDMGVAAMLKNNWQDAEFEFASLSDRNPVSEDDDLIVLAAPDPQGAQHRHALPHPLLQLWHAQESYEPFHALATCFSKLISDQHGVVMNMVRVADHVVL